MKPIFLVLIQCILCTNLFAQAVKDSCCLSKIDLIGVWQRDTKRVGNGLEQYFKFFADGTFEVHFNNESEDVRGIYAIKGKYRLVKNELYLTIISRTVVEGGRITTTGSNEADNLFSIEGGEVKEVKEHDQKELPDPIYIILHGGDCVDIGTEKYFKIIKSDLSK